MKRYYYSCPRGFSNEFDVISVDMTSEKECALLWDMEERYKRSSNINWDFRRITAKEAQKMTSAEKATVRHYERIGMNLTENPVGATEITPITERYSVTPKWEIKLIIGSYKKYGCKEV